MQETKASLQVLTRSSRNEPCNTSESTCHSINQEGLEELRNEPVTIDPLPLPGRAGPGGALPLLAVHLPQQRIVNCFGVKWR